MYNETKDDSSRHINRDKSLEDIKMSQKKALPLNVRILRRQYNRSQSLSERDFKPQTKVRSTISQLIGENTDSSDSITEDRSVRIVEWPKGTSTSVEYSSGSNGSKEIYGLRSRNNELLEYLMEQRGWINELENGVEVLVDSLKKKEEDIDIVLENNTLAEKRLGQMSALEADKLKLTLQTDVLKQVIQEQAESLEKYSKQERLFLRRESSTHLINNSEIGTSDKDNYVQMLQQKIDELHGLVLEKDNKIKDLKEAIQIKDLGLMEFGTTVDEAQRRQTHAEDELVAAYRETDKLRHITNLLQDTVNNRNNELIEIKQKVEVEKEVTGLLQLEKKMMTEKYEELVANEKVSDDKTCIGLLYDELITGENVEVPAENSEESCSNSQVENSHLLRVEGYRYLGFEQSNEIRRKCKPTRAPPPIPNQTVNMRDARKNEEEVAKESDNSELLNQAGYEYFLMCSIAVRLNLAEVYHKDEIMAVDTGKLWEECQICHIPMNKYYIYIEDALREEFGLPKFSRKQSRSMERPIKAHCCIVM